MSNLLNEGINIIYGVLFATWQIFLDASIFIILGLVIAAIIRAFISSDTIAKYIGGNNIRSVFLAALFGVPLPLCSCGVVPAAMALRKQGSSRAATVSFLISTPESSIDSIAITYALIDPLMTVFRPIAAFITGFIAGFVEILFGEKDEKNKQVDLECPHCKDQYGVRRTAYGETKHMHSLFERLTAGFHFSFVELLTDISRWFLIGMVIAGIITYAIPTSFIENYLGSGILSMLIMLAIGLPLYVCATASTPIAAALILKGMSPGAALVFLLAGPATNAASFSVIIKMLGLRSAVTYLISIAVCAVIFGLCINEIYQIMGISIKTSMGHTHEIVPIWLRWITAIPLTIAMLVAAIRKK